MEQNFPPGQACTPMQQTFPLGQAGWVGVNSGLIHILVSLSSRHSGGRGGKVTMGSSRCRGGREHRGTVREGDNRSKRGTAKQGLEGEEVLY